MSQKKGTALANLLFRENGSFSTLQFREWSAIGIDVNLRCEPSSPLYQLLQGHSDRTRNHGYNQRTLSRSQRRNNFVLIDKRYIKNLLFYSSIIYIPLGRTLRTLLEQQTWINPSNTIRILLAGKLQKLRNWAKWPVFALYLRCSKRLDGQIWDLGPWNDKSAVTSSSSSWRRVPFPG